MNQKNADDFQKALVDYLGEVPVHRKTGEKGYSWSGPYDIYKWHASEECQKRAHVLTEATGCGRHYIYRCATGAGVPSQWMLNRLIGAIASRGGS